MVKVENRHLPKLIRKLAGVEVLRGVDISQVERIDALRSRIILYNPAFFLSLIYLKSTVQE